MSKKPVRIYKKQETPQEKKPNNRKGLKQTGNESKESNVKTNRHNQD